MSFPPEKYTIITLTQFLWSVPCTIVITNVYISTPLPKFSIVSIQHPSLSSHDYTTAYYLSDASMPPPPSQNFQLMSSSKPPLTFLHRCSLLLPFIFIRPATALIIFILYSLHLHLYVFYLQFYPLELTCVYYYTPSCFLLSIMIDTNVYPPLQNLCLPCMFLVIPHL